MGQLVNRQNGRLWDFVGNIFGGVVCWPIMLADHVALAVGQNDMCSILQRMTTWLLHFARSKKLQV